MIVQTLKCISLCYIIDTVFGGLDCKMEEEDCLHLLENSNVNATISPVIENASLGTTDTEDKLCLVSHRLERCANNVFAECPCLKLDLVGLKAAASALEVHCGYEDEGLSYAEKTLIVFGACLLFYSIGVIVILCMPMRRRNS